MKCICWKPTAPGHQLDCPLSRPPRNAMEWLERRYPREAAKGVVHRWEELRV